MFLHTIANLKASNNQFTGTIPTEVGTLVNLSKYILACCCLYPFVAFGKIRARKCTWFITQTTGLYAFPHKPLFCCSTVRCNLSSRTVHCSRLGVWLQPSYWNDSFRDGELLCTHVIGPSSEQSDRDRAYRDCRSSSAWYVTSIHRYPLFLSPWIGSQFVSCFFFSRLVDWVLSTLTHASVPIPFFLLSHRTLLDPI